jgi:phenylpyruvate tautomerase PptA (4-oxalocrotonate tautomerase family)
MPLITVEHPAGQLSTTQKSELAENLTRIGNAVSQARTRPTRTSCRKRR